MKRFWSVMFVLVAVQGCSTWHKLNDTERGAVIGGGTGVAVGNVVHPGLGGTVIGGAAGALGGGLIGHEIEEHDDHDYHHR